MRNHLQFSKLISQFFTSIFIIVFVTPAFSQNNLTPSYCGADIAVQRLFSANPAMKASNDSIELKIFNQLNGVSLNIPGGVRQLFTIPVVVHIIHNGGSENIPDAQVLDGIQHLNDAYRNVGFYDPSTGVDVEVEFCLAVQDPNGNSTNGITRTQSTLTDMYLETQDVALKNLSRWNPTKYLNIWVIKEIRSTSAGAGVAGYAFFPNSHGTNIDGIVCEARYFGASPDYSKVHIHEAGHYLGLYHTFQGGCPNSNCLTSGDHVCDTPPDNTTVNVPCSSTLNSCQTDDDDLSSNNPFRPVASGGLGDQNDTRINYMDYGNIFCFSAFTQGQKNRIVAAITGVRNSLLTSNGCQAPCSVPVTSFFTASSTTVTAGTTVTFTNTSTGATTYNWQINGVTFSSATNASYIFNTNGTYTIQLTATNSGGTCSNVFSRIIVVGCSQHVSILWDKTVGGSGVEYLDAALPTPDGGAILGGTTDSGLSGNKTEAGLGYNDYWVVKLNSSGGIQWQNTLGGNYPDQLFTVGITSDGGYILGGNSETGISGDKTEASRGLYDYWVVKLNSTGSIQWQKSLGGSGVETLLAIEQTSDGGYILGGHSSSGISGDKTQASYGSSDFWVVKLNSTGNIVWQKDIGGSDSDYLNTLCKTSDGGYLVGGMSKSNMSGNKTENGQGDWDYWVVKLTSTGTIQWQNNIGGSGDDRLTSVIQTTDGNYVLAGWSNSNISGDKTRNHFGVGTPADYWVVKLNSSGNILWEKTIGGDLFEQECTVVQTLDGGYLLGGSSYSPVSGNKTVPLVGNYDYWLVKLDFSGNILWQKDIGGTNNEMLLTMTQAADGSLILGGYSTSNISGNKTENSYGSQDFWVVKLASCSNQSSPLSLFLGGDTALCNGSPVVLDPGRGFASYYWQDGDTSQTYTATVPGTYWVLLTDTGGYTFFDTIKVHDIVSQPPSIDAGGIASLCPGNIVTLDAGDGYYNYQWQDGWSEQTYTAYLPGTYSVTVSDPCGNTAGDTIIIAADVQDLVNLGNDTSVCNNSIILHAGSGFSYYVWQDGSSAADYTVSSAGTYWVVVTNSSGCMAADTIAVQECNGVINPAGNYFTLYPNPTNNRITLKATAVKSEMTLKLYDALGRLVLQQIAEGNELQQGVTMDLKALNGNIFFLSLASEEESKVMKVMKCY